MTTQSVSRWARWFVAASIAFLLAWQLVTILDGPRRSQVSLALYGFVFHMIFGKAYSLVPAYFARELAFPQAPALQFPFTTIGTVGLVLVPLGRTPAILGQAGAIAWAIGVAIFLVTIGWTVRDNLLGQETGTSMANVERQPIDRMANAFVPVAFVYLVLGTYETLAIHTVLPTLFDGYVPRVTHLLGAGTATILVFAIGFRLLPRFLVANPPRWLVVVVLPTGAIAPILLAAGLHNGWMFQIGAILQTVAIGGFAIAYATLFYRSDRRRVGFYGVLSGVASGVLAVFLGMLFAIGVISPALVAAHLRLLLLGFLGLTIIGVAYQFYPPAIGSFPGAGVRTAHRSIGCIGGGLLLEVTGLLVESSTLTMVGITLAFVGTGLYAYLVLGLFHER